MYNTEQWQEIQERKAGVKILAKITGTPIIGYFKYPANDSLGPVNANEFIAYKLGDKIGVPIPKTEFLNFGERKGTVSFAVPGEANLWSVFPHKNALDYSFNNFEAFATLLLFDLWILNTDRHQENLMYSKIAGDKKYSFFAIDHGHSLYGPGKAPPGNYTEFPLDTLVKIPELKELFKKGESFFDKHMTNIMAMPESEIVEIVNSVPSEFLGDGEKRVIMDMLVGRRNLLEGKIKEFYTLQ